mgnify:FL=1|tara:strand:+ start:857 stop:2260 length:1404 start_codon:yes stop_codon:yes gene_type:complete
MSATLIEQKPLYGTFPVGQDVIFTVSNTSIVSAFTDVKFIAEVYISSTFAPNPSSTTDIVGTFKTTPNNAGVGMFDFRPIIESFVNADNLARQGSAYKTVVNTANSNVPIHLIDKFSGNINSMRYLFIRFKIEYIDAGNLVTTDITNSGIFQLLNGYLKYTDVLDLVGNDFGYNLGSFNLNGTSKLFLTNAPITQYANLEDYGTVGLWMFNAETPTNLDGTTLMEINYFGSDGAYISGEEIPHTSINGGFDAYNGFIGMNLLFFGCFPANLQGSSTMFQNLISAGTIQGGHYTLALANDSGQVMSSIYTINLNCPTLKGFEPIRLTWLNQWGTWDYYTFTMKSSKMISTKGSTYQQMAGSWNESVYRIDSFKGGKKSFRVNATEKITMNTDFVSESDSAWFEELINSPEVYILEGFKTDITDSALNQYVTPVRLTTSSYTKKTVANDKIMQYTFEVEKSKTLRTQAV